MDIPYGKWYEAIQARRSRRQYNKQPIHKKTWDNLENFVKELNSTSDGVRTVLIPECPDNIFKGIIGSYGKIKGASAYATFIGNISIPDVEAKAGYMGECFVLEATSLNLGTCWVAGTLNMESVLQQVGVGREEKVLAITPVGYAKEDYTSQEKVMSLFANSRKRKSLESLCTAENMKKWPEWVLTALEAARLAPSAVNRQPWRFRVEKDSICVTVDNPKEAIKTTKRLDCGIAMVHIEVGALYKGVKGRWEYLNPPDVAVFSI